VCHCRVNGSETLPAREALITLPGSSADFGRLIADETEKWAKVVDSRA
jgi:hypothetical protein